MSKMNRKFKHLGKRFRKIREDLGTWEKDKTLTELAKELELPKSQVSNLENGKIEPSIRILSQYHKKYKIPFEYMLGLSNTKEYDNQNMGIELGLSDKAIKQMKAWNSEEYRLNSDIPESPIFLLNHIFEVGLANQFFKELFRYIYSKPEKIALYHDGTEKAINNVDSSDKIMVASKNFSTLTTLDVKDVEYMYEQSLFNTMRNIKTEILDKKLEIGMPNTTFITGITQENEVENGKHSSKKK